MSSGTPNRLAALRLTAMTLVTAPLVILLAMVFVLPHDDGTAPLWAWGVVALDAVFVAGIVSTLGFRTAAIAPGTPEDEAQQVAWAALQGTTLVRCALTESVAIVALVLAFVVPEGGLLLYVVATVVSVVLSIVLSWPGDRVVDRIRESLERAGGLSYL